MIKTPDEIRAALRRRLFDRRIIQNNFRGEVVEEIVASAIESDWTHCSDDWCSWDFRRDRQLLQVKQAAARQSWDRDGQPVPKRVATFAIRPNSGYYVGAKWESLKKPERLAQIYIFAWHDDATASADHFDFARWIFFVAPTKTLNELDGDRPKATISVAELNSAVMLGQAMRCSLDELHAVLNETSRSCPKAAIPLDD